MQLAQCTPRANHPGANKECESSDKSDGPERESRDEGVRRACHPTPGSLMLEKSFTDFVVQMQALEVL
jgi:hypothetical protein